MRVAVRTLAALPLLLLFSCISPANAPSKTVIGTIALSHVRASTGELMGAEGGVYEVRPLDRGEEPILLIIETPCPSFDVNNLDQDDPSQVFRIEYRSSRFTRWTNLSPSDPAHLDTDNITVKCERLDEKI